MKTRIFTAEELFPLIDADVNDKFFISSEDMGIGLFSIETHIAPADGTYWKVSYYYSYGTRWVAEGGAVGVEVGKVEKMVVDWKVVE